MDRRGDGGGGGVREGREGERERKGARMKWDHKDGVRLRNTERNPTGI